MAHLEAGRRWRYRAVEASVLALRDAGSERAGRIETGARARLARASLEEGALRANDARGGDGGRERCRGAGAIERGRDRRGGGLGERSLGIPSLEVDAVDGRWNAGDHSAEAARARDGDDDRSQVSPEGQAANDRLPSRGEVARSELRERERGRRHEAHGVAGVTEIVEGEATAEVDLAEAIPTSECGAEA